MIGDLSGELWSHYHWEEGLPLSSIRESNRSHWPNSRGAIQHENAQLDTEEGPGSDVSLTRALSVRRSVFRFAAPAPAASILELLRAAYRPSGPGSERLTAPSAGALYPNDIHVVILNTDSTADRYTFDPRSMNWTQGSSLPGLAMQFEMACLMRRPENAGGTIVIVADNSRMTDKYGPRGYRYALLEAGHIAQNICLLAPCLSLGVGLQGGFDDGMVLQCLDEYPASATPLYLLHVGRV